MNDIKDVYLFTEFYSVRNQICAQKRVLDEQKEFIKRTKKI